MSDVDDDIKRLLAARQDIDRALLERHSVEMAVLFTDIVGSTQFFESRGDIEGLARVHRHNDILFPVVTAHGGRVVKTIGDAIMAVFDEPPLAVACAAEMQRRLAAAQAGEDEEPIRVRVGVHAGRVLADGGDVFGDTVNTAARVASAADADEVLLSRSLFESLPQGHGHHVTPKGELTFKGKSEPFPVVSLQWEAGAAASLASGELFVLELGLVESGLKVTALDGARDKGTVKAYAVQPTSPQRLDELADQLGALAHGGGEAAYLGELRARGAELYEAALSERARRRLGDTELLHLRLHVDDALVQVPWEVAFDGTSFLGVRFAVGRLVAALSDDPPRRKVPTDGHLLVVSNPTGDLPAATREGRAVAALLDGAGVGEVRHLDGRRGRDELRAALAGCRLLHFAGHIEAAPGDAGGFVLGDGVLDVAAVTAAFGEGAPGLVFANGCRAQASRGWEASARGVGGLASALLMRGVEHYLAPAWDIPDDDGLFFALRFYEAVVRGEPFGEAARRARESLMSGGHGPLSFASYVLYGDPRTALPRAERRSVARVRSTSKERLPAAGPPPASPKPAARRRPLQLGAALAIAGGAAVGVVAVLQDDEAPSRQPVIEEALPAPEPPAAPVKEGPVRVSVLRFKNVSAAAELEYLRDGLAEVVVTDFGQVAGFRLIERGQIELDIEEIEFSNSKYVDPATRAALGRIKGAEVVVLGAFQQGGGRLRATARFVDVESGEVLRAIKAERPVADVFDLQDDLAAELKKAAPEVRERMRP